MASELQYIELSSLVSEKPRNGLYKGKEYQGRGHRWIKMGDIYKNNFFLNQETELLEVNESEIERFSCEPYDLLFGRTSLTLEGVGDCLLIGEINDTPIFESNLFRIRFNKEKAEPLFYYYYFKSAYGKQLIQKIAKQTAATSITSTDLLVQYVPVYPLSIQKKISKIINQFDQKIELNRQMNETLEAMAQALFKSWFVDFDPVIDNALAAGNAIPDEFTERAEQRKTMQHNTSDNDNQAIRALFPDAFEFTEEMGWIPEGWEITPLSALIKLTGGGTPKTSMPEYWNGDIPWFSVVDAPSSSDIFVLDTEKHVTSLGVEKSSTKILPVGTTIISARGTVGKCAMVSRPMAMNQSCYGVSGNEGVSNTFVYYSVFLSVSELQSKGHGSVFNTITGDTFKSINVAFSGGRLTRKFDNLVSPYFEKILTNSLQVTTLSKLRDTLLPKLMSGELRIADAAAMVEEV